MSTPLPTTLEGLLLESQRLYTKVGSIKILLLSTAQFTANSRDIEQHRRSYSAVQRTAVDTAVS